MRKINLTKICIVVILMVGFAGFLFTPKSEMQTLNPVKMPQNKLKGKNEVAGYKNWTKVNDKPQFVRWEFATLCRMPTQFDKELSESIHNNKYITIIFILN